jgi:uracil-DNA glycosylase family 4
MPKSKSELLDELWSEVEGDKSWDYLRTEGIVCVPGDLPRGDVRVMVVGQNPGAQENAARKPFVGASGRVLDGFLDLGGIGRRNAYVTNVLPYKTPNNRPLTDGEIIHGTKLLREQWKIIRPALTIGVGSQAHLALFLRLMASQTQRGKLMPYGRDSYYCLQYHPSYGLRNPKNRPKMELDWEFMWEQCKEVGGILCDQCKGYGVREDWDCICTGASA